MVKREVNKMVVRAMARTATMLRVRAARMDRKPRRRTQPLLATRIMVMPPPRWSGRTGFSRPQCG